MRRRSKLCPTRMRNILNMNKFSLRRKKLGQYFLKNKLAIEKIAAALALKAGEEVVEIGPGHGELTRALAQTGASITVIEKDPLLADNPWLAGHSRVIRGDALKVLPAISRQFSAASYKLVGNIPYYITGHLLRTISELPHKPALCLLMIQREVAERIIAQPPKMNRLSAITQFWAEPKIILLLSPADFDPPPTVHSAVIALKTRGDAPKNSENYYRWVKILFQQPRKTVVNNLREVAKPGLTKRPVAEVLREMGLQTTARPQDLSLAQIKELSTTLGSFL